MNLIDIVLLILFAWFAFQGFRKGFVIELASLIALILGIYTAIYFSGYAADFLVNSLDMDHDYVPITSFVITFIIVVLIVYVLGRILEKFVNMIALGFLNKLAGGVFGVLKAALFISVFILILNHYHINFISPEKKDNSLLFEHVEEIAPYIWNRLDELGDDKIEKFRDNVDEITI
jgi:membrane protein required for colicin V production